MEVLADTGRGGGFFAGWWGGRGRSLVRVGAISAGVEIALDSASPIVGVMYVMHVTEALRVSTPLEASSGAALGGLGLSRWCGLCGESQGRCGEACCGELSTPLGEACCGERGLRKSPTVTLLPRGSRFSSRGYAPSGTCGGLSAPRARQQAKRESTSLPSHERIRGAALCGRAPQADLQRVRVRVGALLSDPGGQLG